MPAGGTYNVIGTTTLTTSTATVTFSSIPQTYTDLVLVICGTQNSQSDALVRFNSDTNSNYSRIAMYPSSGNSMSSLVQSNQSGVAFSYFNTSIGMAVLNIFNYSNTTTFKPVVAKHNGAGVTQLTANCGMWRSTSAINTVDIWAGGNNYQSGTTMTLYGITAA